MHKVKSSDLLTEIASHEMISPQIKNFESVYLGGGDQNIEITIQKDD